MDGWMWVDKSSNTQTYMKACMMTENTLKLRLTKNHFTEPGFSGPPESVTEVFITNFPISNWHLLIHTKHAFYYFSHSLKILIFILLLLLTMFSPVSFMKTHFKILLWNLWQHTSKSSATVQSWWIMLFCQLWSTADCEFLYFLFLSVCSVVDCNCIIVFSLSFPDKLYIPQDIQICI